MPDDGEEELFGGYESNTYPPPPFRVSTGSSHASASVSVAAGRDARFAPATSTHGGEMDEEVQTTGVGGKPFPHLAARVGDRGWRPDCDQCDS